MAANVLLIDYCDDTIRVNSEWLREDGYDAVAADSVEKGLKAARSRKPDLILLSLCGTEGQGLDPVDICRRLKAGRMTASVPLVMAVLDDDYDLETELACLEAGADHYIVDRVSSPEPIRTFARCRSLLRGCSTSTLPVGDVVFEQDARRVRIGRAVLSMTELEYRTCLSAS